MKSTKDKKMEMNMKNTETTLNQSKDEKSRWDDLVNYFKTVNFDFSFFHNSSKTSLKF